MKFVNSYPHFVDKIIKTVENFKYSIDTIYKAIIKNNHYIGGIVEKNNTMYYYNGIRKICLNKLSTKSTIMWITYVDNSFIC